MLLLHSVAPGVAGTGSVSRTKSCWAHLMSSMSRALSSGNGALQSLDVAAEGVGDRWHSCRELGRFCGEYFPPPSLQ
eukprot:5553374-Amphidinium_carterae.1